MMTLSGVRSSWLMVARKRAFDALARSASARASSSACFLSLADRDVTHHGDNLIAYRCRAGPLPRSSSGWQRISSQRKFTLMRPAEFLAVLTHAKFHRSRIVMSERIAQRRQIGRAIGDMHAVEQTVAQQFGYWRVEQRLRRRRHEQHRAIRAVARNDVGHVTREQAITVFFSMEEPEAGAGHRFDAECKAGCIECGRDNAQRRKRALALIVRHLHRHPLKHVAQNQQARCDQRHRGGNGHNAARCRQRCFERHDDKPDRRKRCDTTGHAVRLS